MIQYFRMPEKDYIRMEEDRVTFDKGTIWPRKAVKYEQVEEVAEVNDIILLKMNDGREQEIHTDWLEEQDTRELRVSLRERIEI
ncbi:hypothetical protein [Halobacillus sp. Marseille-P3879]|uniref:hypothetical protein n=1 Tax=Halobacillus sp. Marseille-P3879 TaxID=2045014 RepID=UPI000C7C8BE8|nr:hypothetical protein [Halobacillus sp. Marseille-P3879]